MNTHIQSTKGEIPEAILAINLEPIMVKAIEEGMTVEKAKLGVRELQRFYMLYKKYGDTVISPSKFMDDMWHYHILDTMNYGPDCDAMFGQFLHHFPYLGLRGRNDKEELDETFERTKELYLREFGEKMLGGGSGTICGTVKSAYCSGGCGNNVDKAMKKSACVSPGDSGGHCVSPVAEERVESTRCQPNCGLSTLPPRPTLAGYLAQSSAH